MEEVVVTGMGCVSALGNTPEILWENLLAGKSGVTTITHFDTSAYEVHLQSVEVDPADGIDRNTMVKTIVNAYNNATSHNSNYEYYHSLFLDEFGIEESYNDNGNPVGDYKVFDAAFKKVFKEGYTGHVEGEDNQFLLYNSYYELLTDRLPEEYEKRLESRNAARRRENLKRKIRREYEKK